MHFSLFILIAFTTHCFYGKAYLLLICEIIEHNIWNQKIFSRPQHYQCNMTVRTEVRNFPFCVCLYGSQRNTHSTMRNLLTVLKITLSRDFFCMSWSSNQNCNCLCRTACHCKLRGNFTVIILNSIGCCWHIVRKTLPAKVENTVFSRTSLFRFIHSKIFLPRSKRITL